MVQNHVEIPYIYSQKKRLNYLHGEKPWILQNRRLRFRNCYMWISTPRSFIRTTGGSVLLLVLLQPSSSQFEKGLWGVTALISQMRDTLVWVWGWPLPWVKLSLVWMKSASAFSLTPLLLRSALNNTNSSSWLASLLRNQEILTAGREARPSDALLHLLHQFLPDLHPQWINPAQISVLVIFYLFPSESDFSSHLHHPQTLCTQQHHVSVIASVWK